MPKFECDSFPFICPFESEFISTGECCEKHCGFRSEDLPKDLLDELDVPFEVDDDEFEMSEETDDWENGDHEIGFDTWAF